MFQAVFIPMRCSHSDGDYHIEINEHFKPLWATYATGGCKEPLPKHHTLIGVGALDPHSTAPSCLQLVKTLLTAPLPSHLPITPPSLPGAWNGKEEGRGYSEREQCEFPLSWIHSHWNLEMRCIKWTNYIKFVDPWVTISGLSTVTIWLFRPPSQICIKESWPVSCYSTEKN